MYFDNFYEKIEEIPFLGYEVDKIHNYELFNELKYVLTFAKENKLGVIVGGSWGSILHCSKLYRTVKDIDLHFKEEDMYLWFDYLKDKYNFIYPPNMEAENFIKNQLNSQHPLPFQNIKKPSLKLDIIFKNVNLFNKIGVNHRIFTKSFEDFNIKYVVLFKSREFTKIYDRQVDKDDIEFFSKYIKHEELL
jgi:hypothetical protein